MGLCVSFIRWILFRKSVFRILMLGLDNVGKTTILYQLKINEIVTTCPTNGFNVESLLVNNKSFVIWDVGGERKIRPLWRHYYRDARAVIFVIDSADRERLEEAKNELMIINDYLHNRGPILIYANKNDDKNLICE